MLSDSRGFIRTPLILYMNHLDLVAYEPIYSRYTTLQQSNDEALKDEALRILSEYSLIIINSKKTNKIRRIERLISFYGYNIQQDGKISKLELALLEKIKKEYKIKSKIELTPQFYKELYVNAPVFVENKIKNKKLTSNMPQK